MRASVEWVSKGYQGSGCCLPAPLFCDPHFGFGGTAPFLGQCSSELQEVATVDLQQGASNSFLFFMDGNGENAELGRQLEKYFSNVF